MIRKNGKPYIWVTWITGLLSNDDQCAWKAWIKAHFQYDKPEPTQADKDNLNSWLKKHDAMVAARAKTMAEEGYEVLVERQNKFTLEGQVAAIAGQPDVIGVKRTENRIHITDQKSGRVKSQYTWQVLIYMLAKSLMEFKGFRITGEVEYADQSVQVAAEQLSNGNKERIGKIIQLVGGHEEPKRAPSLQECQYCDIIECPDRFKAGDAKQYF